MAIDSEAQGLALAARSLAEARAEGYFPIACRTGVSFNRQTASSGWSALCVSRHVLPYGAIDAMPVYAGFATVPAEVSISALAGVHVGVAADFAGQAAWGSTGNGKSVVRRVSSGGGMMRELTVPTDGCLVPDPVACVRPAGAAMACRIWVPAWGGSGTAFQASRSLASGEFSYFGNGATDLAWGGGAPATSIQTTIQPIAVLGRAADRKRHPALAIVGDSNSYGTRSTASGTSLFDTLDADGNSGWIERSLQSRIAFSNFGTPGDRLDYWMNSSGGAGGRRYSRMAAIRNLGFSHVLLALNGTNDAGIPLTAAQIQDRWRNLLDELLGTGARVWATTPLPLTGSSDGWTTAANQGLGTSGAAIQAMADWIRANALSSGCERVIDVNAALNPDNSGKWRTDLVASLGAPPTYDGVHMSQAMTEWVAAQGLIAPGMLGS